MHSYSAPIQKLTMRYELEGTSLRTFSEAEPEMKHSVDLDAPELQIVEKASFHPQFWRGCILTAIAFVYLGILSFSAGTNPWQEVQEIFEEMRLSGIFLLGCLGWGLIKILRHVKVLRYTAALLSKNKGILIHRNKNAVAEYEAFVNAVRKAANQHAK